MTPRRLLLFWAPLLFWAALIFWFSSQPAQALSRFPIRVWDKLAHTVTFGVLGLLAHRALRHGGPGLGPNRALAWSVVIAVIYGAGDELHQAVEPSGTRVASVADLAADAIGAMLGSGLYFLASRRPSPGAQLGPADPESGEIGDR